MKRTRGLAGLFFPFVLLALAGCPTPNNPDPLSDNADLSALSIAEAALSPAFQTDVTEYSATVPYAVAVITVSATAADVTATVRSGIGSHDLPVGSKTIDIIVEAEDGTTRMYSITVTRSVRVQSSNADLSSLSLAGATITPPFSASQTDYAATVPYLTRSVTVSATAADPQAAIQQGTGVRSLSQGDNIIYVVVRAEDGTTRTYSITATREAPVGRTFRAQRVTDSVWYDLPASLLASGDHALVFVENTQSITDAVAMEIAAEFDAGIYDLVRDGFAPESDVDSNGKVILLLLDIIDGFTGSGGYVAGYFDPTHLFSTSTFSNSNEAEMLFMDVDPAVAGSASFFNTVAHEMQHLVNFVATYLVDGTSQDLWINEGLSSGAEYLYAGVQIASRINYYNSDPLETIAYGNNFFVWNGYWEQVVGDVLADYATVYLFFQWLRIHASNDTGIYQDILSSSYRDHRTVVNAAGSRIDASLSSWETVLGTWMTANLLNDSSGTRGYAGELSTTPWQFTNTGGATWDLSSGEGLVVQTDGGAYTYPGGSGTYIRYNGINTGTSAVDTSGPDYSGDLVLAYNANTAISGADQTAVLPSITSKTSGLDLAVSSVAGGTVQSVYPVDVLFTPGGQLDPQSHRPGSGKPSRTADVNGNRP